MTPSLSQPPARERLAHLVVAGERPLDVVQFEVETVGFFVDAAELLGVPKSVAAIYGIVFASPEPLTFSQIESRLDISKGSVSQGLRVLRDVGALKTLIVSDRREVFVPELDLRFLIERFLEKRLEVQLNAGEERLAGILRQVPSSNPANAELLRKRFKHLNAWHTRARKLLPVAQSFLKLGK